MKHNTRSSWEPEERVVITLDGIPNSGTFQIDRKSAMILVKQLALDMGYQISTEQANPLAFGLDAAYEYDKELCRVARAGNYNFDKHDGDWIDYHQLFYLIDPQMHLLTDDGALLTRVSKSAQKGRILLLCDFLRSLGFLS